MKAVLSTLALGLTFFALFFGCLFAAHALSHVKGCRSKACDRRVHQHRRLHWKHAHPWQFRWHHLSAADRRWARCIAYWETFGTPWAHKATVVGIGGHLGAVQFDPRTAVAAGFDRNVTTTSLTQQLVRAVWWRNRAGASQWSTSGKCA